MSDSVRPRAGLRILHVIGSVSPARGGPSTAIWMMLDALRAHGIRADLATTDDDGPSRRLDRPLGRMVLERGHSVAYFPRQTRPYALSAPLFRWLHRNVSRYDLVDSHGLFTFAPVAAAWWARERAVPYVIRPAGVLNRWGRTQRRPWLKRASLALLESGLLRDASLVHFTSDRELEEAADLGIAMRPAVLPLGLSAPEESVAPPTGEPQAQVVLFIGRITPIKNIDLLIDAFARVADGFPRARLVIAGEGPAAHVEPLRARARASGVGARIDWLGFVQGAAKEAALRSAAVLVLPSASENFGIAAVEGLARGIPVLVSRGVGIAARIEAAQAGLSCDASVVALSQGLADLLGHPERRRVLGAAGRRLFAEEYSLAALGQGLRRAYESILADRAQHGTRRSER
jgi:glycosyltransferase involved in cell wall biosynthesis